MSKKDWIGRFEPLNRDKLIDAVLESASWIEQHCHTKKALTSWDVLPGNQIEEEALLLSDTSLYGGASGIALFYLRLFVALEDSQWLEKAKAGIDYVISQYQGKQEFYSSAPYLPGAYTGFFHGPAGGGYVAKEIYKVTGEKKYRTFACQVANDLIEVSESEHENLLWNDFYGILGGGGLLLYLIDLYEEFGDKRYLEEAEKGARHVYEQKESAPCGGSRWHVMPTETFPTIGKPGGYFPGFEYGTAGCGYLMAKIYEHTKDRRYLEEAKNAALYIQKIADYSDDESSALVRYNDPHLPDLYYLGVCQGPPGTSRLFFQLYRLTGEDQYLEFISKLTNGMLAAGVPAKHSEGFWRTNSYCCGAAGMLEHFINIHKLTGKAIYLDAAYDTAECIIGDSTHLGTTRNWYTAWNRHEPWKSEAYTGLYLGSAGCASALLMFAQYIGDLASIPPYMEDPYKILFNNREEKRL